MQTFRTDWIWNKQKHTQPNQTNVDWTKSTEPKNSAKPQNQTKLNQIKQKLTEQNLTNNQSKSYYSQLKTEDD